jgi:hypothetical protein
MLSLRKFELCYTVTLAQVCLLTGDTAVPDIDLLRRLVATGHFRELAHVADPAPAGFLAVNPVKARGLSLLDLLDLVNRMNPAEGAVRGKFCWHLHEISPIILTTNTYIICRD